MELEIKRKIDLERGFDPTNKERKARRRRFPAGCMVWWWEGGRNPCTQNPKGALGHSVGIGKWKALDAAAPRLTQPAWVQFHVFPGAEGICELWLCLTHCLSPIKIPQPVQTPLPCGCRG